MKLDNFIVVGDLHAKEEALEELDSIFTEIISYKAKNIIFLGDTFHSNRPKATEIEFITRWMRQFRDCYEDVYVIKGNHDDYKDGVSCVDYLKHLDIHIVPSMEYQECLFGHFMVNESQLSFGTGKYSIADLKDYRYVLLGHQHLFQEVAPNIYHLGAVRKCDFGEALYPQPKIALFKDGELEFKTLESPSNIIIASHPNELIGLGTDKRVLYIFNNFEQFLNEIGIVNDYKKTVKELKIKMNFKKDDKKIDKNENQSFKELFQAFLENLSPDVKKELEEVVTYEV